MLFQVLPRANRHVLCVCNSLVKFTSKTDVLVGQASVDILATHVLVQTGTAGAGAAANPFMIKLSMSPTPVGPYPLL